MESFLQAIANFGFPIVVSAFLLFRFESKLEKLEDAINGKEGLCVNIQRLTDEVKALHEEVQRRKRG
jgi:hypothetical protein